MLGNNVMYFPFQFSSFHAQSSIFSLDDLVLLVCLILILRRKPEAALHIVQKIVKKVQLSNNSLQCTTGIEIVISIFSFLF